MRRWLGLSSVMMSSLEKGDGDLSEGSFGRWGPSRVFLQAVNVFLHGERFRPTPPPPPRVVGNRLQVVYPTPAHGQAQTRL